MPIQLLRNYRYGGYFYLKTLLHKILGAVYFSYDHINDLPALALDKKYYLIDCFKV